MEKWDRRFLELAAFYAQWSKDPSTKVGAVITRGKVQVSQGFNGLPQKVKDLPGRLAIREKKNSMIIHGEMNAILFSGHDLHGCTLYTFPFAPCNICAPMVVQAGITRVVAPVCMKEEGHWMHESLHVTREIFKEAGVELVEEKITMMVYVVSEKGTFPLPLGDDYNVLPPS
jgi:dCMP deaminase